LISIQEVHFYNQLAEKGIVKKITCPFNEDDIVITKFDNDKVYFNCITCNSTFYPGINVIENIKTSINKYNQL
jgi:hypothetical protein